MPLCDLFLARAYVCVIIWFINFLAKLNEISNFLIGFGIIDCENRNLVHSSEGIPCNNQGSLIKFYGKMPACTFVPTCNLLAKAADICATITISIC